MHTNKEQTDKFNNILNQDTQYQNKKSKAQPSLLSSSEHNTSQETRKRRLRTKKDYEIKHFYD
ncbi:hypothetical protein DB313_05470 (plasmid) [Borrelia turcica IST7]|uniref:Uncharacterized protein n=1 Tax=Borrelia turcica IST7 TaxID=1104446 RepID=A0A386PNZ8_9SPIR|nr:hypothetical protein [Borrelia turcica]AYE36948.1 hypothetical protein DB313_05470 [Borrelia turcica IST7]